MSNILEFPNSNLRDIPAMLRQLADDIDSGIYGEAERSIVILDANELHMFAWGDGIDILSAIGLVEIGKHTLVGMTFDNDFD